MSGSTPKCRFCLNCANEELREIKIKDLILVQRITNLQISIDDGLPSTMCNQCSHTIEVIKHFAINCERSYQLLKTTVKKEDGSNDGGLDFIEIQDDSANINPVVKQECSSGFEHWGSTRTDDNVLNIRKKLKQEETPNDIKNKDTSDCIIVEDNGLNVSGRLHQEAEPLKATQVSDQPIILIKRKFKCVKCRNIFLNRRDIQNHQCVPSNQPKSLFTMFVCNYCQTGFSTYSHLNMHMKTHADTITKVTPPKRKITLPEKPLERRYNCDICSKDFETKELLYLHTVDHQIAKMHAFACEICKKCFPTKTGRDIHLKLHTGERRYKCEFCQKSFHYRIQWLVHLREHSGKAPFTCTYCRSDFHDKPSLRRHKCEFIKV